MNERDNGRPTPSHTAQELVRGVEVETGAAHSERRRRRLRALGGIVAFGAGSAFTVSHEGLLISDDTVFLWVLTGLFALSLSDLGRWRRGMLIDWLPLGALLVFYDSSRGFSQLLGTPTHQALQIDFDERLFGRPLLALQLQHWLHQGTSVKPWEYPLFVVYMSHFFMALLVAGLLWRFAYPRFRQFRARLIVLYGIGFLTYVLYPVAPPWMVAQTGAAVPAIHRVVVQVWNHAGLATADTLIEHGNAFYNQVAAVPSLHAAVSLLILLFLWRQARWWLRALMLAYVLAMAFILVDGGEHYVFDIAVGWLYAIAVTAGFALADATRARRHAARLRATVAAPPPTPSPLIQPSDAPRLGVLAPPRENAAWHGAGQPTVVAAAPASGPVSPCRRGETTPDTA